MVEAFFAQLSKAVGTLVAVFVTALATAIVAWIKNRRTRQRLENEQLDLGRAIQAKAPYGLSAKRIVSAWTVLDVSGTLRRRTTVEGLKVSDGVTLSYLRHHFSQTPGSIRNGISLAHVEPFPKHVSVRCVENDVSNYVYRVEIAGGLTSTDPPLTYTDELVYESAVLMTNDAVAKVFANDDFKKDYFAWEVGLPTSELCLEVTFPAPIKVTYYPGVFWGRSEWWFHNQELNRVVDSFTRTSSGARFVVSNPVVGFRYFIYWTFEE